MQLGMYSQLIREQCLSRLTLNMCIATCQHPFSLRGPACTVATTILVEWSCICWNRAHIWPQISSILFMEIINALLWIMRQNDTTWSTHYIDHFLTIRAISSSEYFQNISRMWQLAGLPIGPNKSVNPAFTIVFWRIKIDSNQGILWFLAEKNATL